MVDWATVGGFSAEGDIDNECGETAEQRMSSNKPRRMKKPKLQYPICPICHVTMQPTKIISQRDTEHVWICGCLDFEQLEEQAYIVEKHYID